MVILGLILAVALLVIALRRPGESPTPPPAEVATPVQPQVADTTDTLPSPTAKKAPAKKTPKRQKVIKKTPAPRRHLNDPF